MQTNYLQHVFTPEIFPRTVDSTIKKVEELKKETDFDTIAFTGISGAAMAFILSHWLDVPLLCVRKQGESSHYHQLTRKILEGNVHDVRKYIIVDDFIASGSTLRRVVDAINHGNYMAKCVGLVMYAEWRSQEPRKWKHPDWTESLTITNSRPEGT